jgi:hypothetical protein
VFGSEACTLKRTHARIDDFKLDNDDKAANFDVGDVVKTVSVIAYLT